MMRTISVFGLGNIRAAVGEAKLSLSVSILLCLSLTAITHNRMHSIKHFGAIADAILRNLIIRALIEKQINRPETHWYTRIIEIYLYIVINKMEVQRLVFSPRFLYIIYFILIHKQIDMPALRNTNR